MRYGTRRSGDKSGAYLFLPDGPAKPIPVEGPLVRVVEGKIISYIEVVLAFAIHTVTLKSSPGMNENFNYSLSVTSIVFQGDQINIVQCPFNNETLLCI